MAEIVVVEHVTLDGVMQAPGRPGEDDRGGFAHGGWAAARSDEAAIAAMGAYMSRGGPLLLGRRTYEDFAGFWPRQTGNPFTAALDAARKYVASRTLSEPLPWQNSVLLAGDAAEQAGRLRADLDGHLVVMGSGELVQTLLAADLVDRLLLMVHPIVLGTGRRLFPDGGVPATLELLDSSATPTGVVLATYGRATG